ncbi:MAG: response regulator, partial [Ghiorsea sp.]|nr:response regulator [Ghiorsea sp.]
SMDKVIISEALMAEAQKISHVVSWELDLQSDHLTWSDEIYRIFEIDKTTFGASYDAFLDAIHPEDRDRVNQAYTQALETKQPYEINHRLLMADGRIKHVTERCKNVFDASGQAILSMGTVQDISTLVAAQTKEASIQSKMEHVQRLESLGILAGGIAHDFNNILTAIMGNAGLASNKLPEISPAHGYIQRITQASQKAADLCKQMLAYSGKGKFIIKPVLLAELVEEMGQILHVSIAKSIVLRFDLNKQTPAIDADVTQIQQIIMNLVINASEAIGEHSGAISVSTGIVRLDKRYLATTFIDEDLEEGAYVYLEVSDTGCGMCAEVQGKIFEPFFTTKFTGRGLGMAAILGIVRGHKGAIKVYSEEGKGSTFKVLFPYSKKEAIHLQDREESEANWHGEGTVLIIDDEETIREVAASMLTDIGIQSMTACDGVEGIEVFQKHHKNINAVLLDMTMPRMGGEDAFTELCRIDPDVKVILSSGYNEQDATNRFAGKGLAGFLQKPYTPEQLADKMAAIFNKT